MARTAIADWLRARGSRLLVVPEQVIPAPSLWIIMRQWVGAYRANRLAEGSALGFALPCNGAGIAAWLAAAWENLALVLPSHALYGDLDVRCAPGETFEPESDRLAPRVAAIATPPRVLAPGVHVDGEVLSWDALFAPTTWGPGPARGSLVTRLDGDGWLTITGMRELARATLLAEEIWFMDERELYAQGERGRETALHRQSDG
ncbi:MAG: hypothetical protein SFX73_13395 [Kofleriaceae bacterium]|nr:hypothetical protein [Kofleriaceae bacterium]